MKKKFTSISKDSSKKSLNLLALTFCSLACIISLVFFRPSLFEFDFYFKQPAASIYLEFSGIEEYEPLYVTVLTSDNTFIGANSVINSDWESISSDISRYFLSFRDTSSNDFSDSAWIIDTHNNSLCSKGTGKDFKIALYCPSKGLFTLSDTFTQYAYNCRYSVDLRKCAENSTVSIDPLENFLVKVLSSLVIPVHTRFILYSLAICLELLLAFKFGIIGKPYTTSMILIKSIERASLLICYICCFTQNMKYGHPLLSLSFLIYPVHKVLTLLVETIVYSCINKTPYLSNAKIFLYAFICFIIWPVAIIILCLLKLFVFRHI